MIKKVVVSLMLAVIGCVVCFGRGMYEKDSLIQIKQGIAGVINKKHYRATIEPVWGKYKITIMQKNVAWAVLYKSKIDNSEEIKYTVSDFFKKNGGKEIDVVKIKRMTDGVALKLTEEKNSEYNIEEIKYSTGTHQETGEFKIQDTIQFYLDNCNVRNTCEILFVKENHQVEYLTFKIIPEFFMGELKLFGVSEDYRQYEMKCASFLKNFYNTSNILDILKKVFDPAIIDSIDLSAYADDTYYENFKTAMSSHIRKKYEYRELKKRKDKDSFDLNVITVVDTPYLDFSEIDPYEALYSKEKQNKFIAVYMQFLYSKDKPALSYIIQERLNNAREIVDTNNKTFLNYDYNNYTAISVEEGQGLAENALRYLTWGVEYTPNTFNSLDLGNSGNRVYNSCKDKIIEWIGFEKDFTRGPRKDNYLKGGAMVPESKVFTSQTSSPCEIQKIEGEMQTNKVKIIGHLINNLRMTISRIDLWTSRNIAWDYENAIPFYSCEKNKYEYNGDKSKKMQDMKVFLESKEILHNDALIPGNLHLKRIDNNPIQIGYKFKNPVSISGILIVRGLAAEQTDTYDNKYSIEVNKSLRSDEYNSKYIINSKEYVVYNDRLSSVVYNNDPTLPPKSFGESLWSKKYSNEGKLLTYTYILFDQVKECYGIKLIDKTKNAFLNISEFMVFSENPINFKSIENKSLLIGTVESANTKKDNKMLYNCDPQYRYIGNRDNIDWLVINFNQYVDLKTVVIYEHFTKENKSSSFYNKNIMVVSDMFSYNEELFPDMNDELQFINDFNNSSEVKITTPFFGKENGAGIYGNPIPYAPKGIDCPRTFNLKMRKQVQARHVYFYGNDDITRPGDETTNGINYGKKPLYNGYSNEMNLWNKLSMEKNGSYTYDMTLVEYMDFVKKGVNERYKPYLPGSNINVAHGYTKVPQSLYFPDKIAGVDSIGIVCGALSMTSINDDSTNNNLGVLNMFNIDVGDVLDIYYNYTVINPYAEFISGVKSDIAPNRPIFYAGETNTLLNGIYRFTMSDFEKNTIVVPDNKEIRAGDLIIRYNYYYNKEEAENKNKEKCDDESIIDDEIHAGIVIRVGNSADPIEKFMDNTYLVSIKKGFRMTTLGTWGKRNGFNGFSAEPNKYQIRRFLKAKTGILAQRTIKDPWECVQEYPHHLECRLELPDDEYLKDFMKNKYGEYAQNYSYKNHWIPNTGEMFEDIKVIINPKNEDNKDIVLNDLPVSFLPPVDPNFDNTFKEKENAPDELNNINTNRGEGLEIYLLKNKWYDKNSLTEYTDENQLPIKLATFMTPKIQKSYYRKTIKEDLSNSTDNDEKYYDYRFYKPYEDDFLALFGSKDYNPYTFSNENSFFTANGTPGKGALMVKRLKIDGQTEKNYLCYEEGGKLYLDFGIKALEFAMPGDDFQLRFFMPGNPTVAGTVGEGDFVAVYDKKLLWRANLYIDEGVHPTEEDKLTGKADWNDKNPWGNEFDTMGNEWYQVSLQIEGKHGHVDGGQVVEIKPWTSAFEPLNVFNSVAYSWGCVDSPYHFNLDMLDQEEALKAFGNVRSDYPTLAPNNNWNKYIHGKEYILEWDSKTAIPNEVIKQIIDNFQTINPSASPEEINNFIIALKSENLYYLDYLSIDDPDGSGVLYPYIPQLTTYLFFHPEGRNKLLQEYRRIFKEVFADEELGEKFYLYYYPFKKYFEEGLRGSYCWLQVPYSAGVDCSGLVSQAILYNGNNYKIVSDGFTDIENINRVRDTYNSDALHGRVGSGTLKDSKYSWLIFDHEFRNNDYKKTDTFKIPIVPGDIVLTYDTNKITTNHVMIVQSVMYEKETRNAIISGIVFIEATKGFNSEYRVLNNQSFYNYSEHKNYFGKITFRRLATKE